MNLNTINSGTTTEVIRNQLNDNFSNCLSSLQTASASLSVLQTKVSNLQNSPSLQNAAINFSSPTAILTIINSLPSVNYIVTNPASSTFYAITNYTVYKMLDYGSSFVYGVGAGFANNIVCCMDNNGGFYSYFWGTFMDDSSQYKPAPTDFSKLRAGINETRKIVIGLDQNSSQLFISENSGDSWSVVNNGGSMHFETNLDGSVILVHKMLQKAVQVSTDSGQTFTTIPISMDGNMWDPYPYSLAVSRTGKNMAISVDLGNNDFRVYVSTNFGNSWNHSSSAPPQAAFNLKFFNETTLGLSSAYGNQVITKDYGVTWQPIAPSGFTWLEYIADGVNNKIIGFSSNLNQYALLDSTAGPTAIENINSFVQSNSANWNLTDQQSYVRTNFLPISGGRITGQLSSRNDVILGSLQSDPPTLCVDANGVGINTTDTSSTLTVNGNMEVTNRTVFMQFTVPSSSITETPLQTTGNIIKKMEVFDYNGVSLGFIPIYNSIS